MSATEAANKAVVEIRRLLAECDGSEAEALRAFADIVGSEVDGIEFRLSEIEEDAV